MNQLRTLIRTPTNLLAAALVCLSCSWAHAIPTGTVDFQPGNGTFTFQFSGGAAEFDGTECDTCTLTFLSWNLNHSWTSTGIGNGGLQSFSVTFDNSGTIIHWSFSLFESDVVTSPHGNPVGSEDSASVNELEILTGSRGYFEFCIGEVCQASSIGGS